MNQKYIRLEDTEYIENSGDILVCKYSHLMYPNGTNAIHDDNVKHIDGKDWEVFNVHHETKDAYYGMRLLGLGLFNCRAEKSDCRQFTQEELERYNKLTVGIYGSHTGKFSGQFYGVNIKQVVSKWGSDE